LRYEALFLDRLFLLEFGSIIRVCHCGGWLWLLVSTTSGLVLFLSDDGRFEWLNLRGLLFGASGLIGRDYLLVGRNT
jgi:hypothetical protein